MDIAAAHVESSLRRFLTICLVLLGLTFFAEANLAAQTGQAQDGGSARIYHLEGTDFSLSQNDDQALIRSDAVRGGGINLERSGIIHTAAGTYLELQLIPSGTVIKLAGNTSLVYNGFDETGKFTDLGLLYGRMRVITNGRNSVVVRSGGVSARIDDGDLGIDYFVRPDGSVSQQQPIHRYHVFRGSTEVFNYGQGGALISFGSSRSLAAVKGESLTLDISSSYTFAERKPLNRDAVAFWRLNNFSGTPPLFMPNTTIEEALPEVVSAAPIIEYIVTTPEPEVIIVHAPAQSSRRDNRAKNTLLSLGFFLTASSAAVQGVAYYQPDFFPDNTARDLYTWSYVPLGLGLLSTLVGILINPSTSLK